MQYRLLTVWGQRDIHVTCCVPPRTLKHAGMMHKTTERWSDELKSNQTWETSDVLLLSPVKNNTETLPRCCGHAGKSRKTRNKEVKTRIRRGGKRQNESLPQENEKSGRFGLAYSETYAFNSCGANVAALLSKQRPPERGEARRRALSSHACRGSKVHLSSLRSACFYSNPAAAVACEERRELPSRSGERKRRRNEEEAEMAGKAAA